MAVTLAETETVPDSITPLAMTIGAEIDGVDLTKPI